MNLLGADPIDLATDFPASLYIGEDSDNTAEETYEELEKVLDSIQLR